MSAGNNIGYQSMSSCAMSDLSGLCRYGGAPEKAMADFMKKVGNYTFARSCLICYHGVIDAAPEERDEKGGWCRGCKYVQEFTAFIREHHLGTVVEGAQAENPIHPGHIIQAYIWAPDYAALDRWTAATSAASKKSVVISTGGK